MEQLPTSHATAAAASRRRLGARVVAAALVAVAVPLALAGGELVAGTTPGGDPGWLLGVFGEGFVDRPIAYLCLLWVAIALWAALLALARELGLRTVAIVAAGLLILFALASPLLSLDVFSYISYGRLGAEHGLNPYEHAPVEIAGLDEAARRVADYRDAVSVYGPAFTLLSYPLAALGVPAALWSLKALAALAVGVVAWIVARLARRRGVDPAFAVAFVALNPLVLVHLVGGAHNDALMVAIATAALAAALTARPAAAGAGFILAAAVKVSGLLYAPFAVLGAGSGRGRLRMLAGAALALALVAAVALAAFGTAVDAALTVAGENQDRVSRWSVPATLARIGGLDVDPIRTVLAIALAAAVAGLLVAVARGLDWVRAAGWAAFGVLVASAYVVPWYLLWLLPPAAISRDRALIGATILLTAFQAVNGVPV